MVGTQSSCLQRIMSMSGSVGRGNEANLSRGLSLFSDCKAMKMMTSFTIDLNDFLTHVQVQVMH